MNQLEQKLQIERGEHWVKQAKQQAIKYQQELKRDSYQSQIGRVFLTTQGAQARLIKVQPEAVTVEFTGGVEKVISWDRFSRWIPMKTETLSQLGKDQQLRLQLQILTEQKRRVNQSQRSTEEKQGILKGLDLAMQALQNLHNPNNQW